MKTLLKTILALVAVAVAAAAWLLWGGVSNPAARKTIGDISAPAGFERVAVPEGSFGAFVRGFPLKGRGAHMEYYDGSLAYFQYMGYAVLDLPMLSNIEQCADAVMRMRAEYLWSAGRYADIHFKAFSGKTMRYGGGADREKFEAYLRKVYDVSNTSTLRHELRGKPLGDMVPGDVFVYEAHGGRSVGHAVLVADVAVDRRTGRKAVMLAQSSTPALTMHVVRNVLNPFRSPWVILDGDSEGISISHMSFKADDLREFPE